MLTPIFGAAAEAVNEHERRTVDGAAHVVVDAVAGDGYFVGLCALQTQAQRPRVARKPRQAACKRSNPRAAATKSSSTRSDQIFFLFDKVISYLAANICQPFSMMRWAVPSRL